MILPLIASLALAGPQDDYNAGVAALQAKDATTAQIALARCVSQAPERVDCLWELGWAQWLLGDWTAVVTTWERVLNLDADHPDAEKYLAEARENAAMQARVQASRADVPARIAPPRKGAALRIRAVGDVMLGTDFPKGHLPPDDGAHLLDDMGPWLQDADLTFANLEGPLCDGGKTSKCVGGGNCYAFRTPTRYGQYIADAGVDLVSVANNHTNDFGAACMSQTTATLDTLGITWSGVPGSIGYTESNGLTVALVAFHTAPTSNHLNNLPAAIALVQEANRRAHVVIVSFHGGAEGVKATHVPAGRETFYGENRGSLREFTHAVVDAGADLVLGHGPHVLRGMEVYQDRLIAYSLGNFATYGRFNLSGPLGVGVILEVELDGEGRFVGGQLLPTKQVGQGVPVFDPNDQALDLVRTLSSEDFPGTGVVVARDGSLGAQ
jgi:poly-gamma-glutamate capsule biosynthesis protein CapA/YwtB (metallophosphatase superfamily)